MANDPHAAAEGDGENPARPSTAPRPAGDPSQGGEAEQETSRGDADEPDARAGRRYEPL